MLQTFSLFGPIEFHLGLAWLSVAESWSAGAVNNATFGHRDLVRVIWSFIHAYGTLEAVQRFEEGLKRITAASGHPEEYHATITHASTFLVGERIAEQGPLNRHDFEAANALWP